MVRFKMATIALVAALFATTLSAQTFISEDWSAGVGTTPPPGWSTFWVQNSPGSGTPGDIPAEWRWDNPNGRTFGAPGVAPWAISDSDGDQDSGAGFYTSTLRSAAFNATGTTLIELDYDTYYFGYSNGFANTEVFDGTVWNTITSWTTTSVGTAATPSHQYADVTAAAGGAANAQLRFVYNYSWAFYWIIDNVSLRQPPSNDIAVSSIDSPVYDPTACIDLSGNQTVTCTVTNAGAGIIPAVSLIQLDLYLNGSIIGTEFINNPAALNPGDTYQHTFVTMANFIGGMNNSLTVTAVNPGDGDPTNDSVTENYMSVVGGSLVSLPYFEDFSTGSATTLPAGWNQVSGDAGGQTGTYTDWYCKSGITGSFNTGPANGYDHTIGAGGIYCYVEDSYTYPDIVMESPCIDLTLATAPLAQFWLSSFNGNTTPTTAENFFHVDVASYPGGAVTMDAVGPIGNLNPVGATSNSQGTWQQQTLNLAPFAGQVVKLLFRANTDNGGTGTFYHDICVDDVSIFEPVATPGQAPRPGMAAFDINNAINGNTAAVSSGLGGPYYANVNQGGNMHMSFDGEANQPIAVIYGSLNPVSATYGAIGQFDIGGPGVNGAGLPNNLGVFVDAISWTGLTLGIESMFFTGSAGLMDITFLFPSFGITPGTVLTSFQAAITSTMSPFVYLSNAVELTVN